jgi:Lipase (class 3)
VRDQSQHLHFVERVPDQRRNARETAVSVFLGGHSLGASDAALEAYSRVRRGLPLDGLFLFACPRPGDHVVWDTLAAAKVPILSVVNDQDGVCDVPFDVHVQQLGWSYERAPIAPEIFEAPSFADFLADPFFAHHHIQLYQRGTNKLEAGSLAITNQQAVAQVARLYDPSTAGWDWINTTDGLYWGMVKIGDARLMIRRGSKTGTDWLNEDFDFNEIDLYGAKVSQGFWAGVGPIESELDKALS